MSTNSLYQARIWFIGISPRSLRILFRTSQALASSRLDSLTISPRFTIRFVTYRKTMKKIRKQVSDKRSEVERKIEANKPDTTMRLAVQAKSIVHPDQLMCWPQATWTVECRNE